MKTLISIAIAAVGAATALPAQAATLTGDAASVLVSYGDLNLASTLGTQRLDRRIKAAAKQVCGNAGVNGIAAQQRTRTCIAQALEAARPQVRMAMQRAPGANVSIALVASR